ncbi:hypothetical protein LTR95_012046 [Oleoguttula sp. CCFEE 5521]
MSMRANSSTPEADIATRCKALPVDVSSAHLAGLVQEFRETVIARIKAVPVALLEDWNLAAETCFALLEKHKLHPLDRAQVQLYLAGMWLDEDLAVQQDHLLEANDLLSWFEDEADAGGCGETVGRYCRSLRRRHENLTLGILEDLQTLENIDRIHAERGDESESDLSESEESDEESVVAEPGGQAFAATKTEDSQDAIHEAAEEMAEETAVDNAEQLWGAHDANDRHGADHVSKEDAMGDGCASYDGAVEDGTGRDSADTAAGKNPAGENAAGEETAGEEAIGEKDAGEKDASMIIVGASVLGGEVVRKDTVGVKSVSENVVDAKSSGEDISREVLPPATAGIDTATINEPVAMRHHDATDTTIVMHETAAGGELADSHTDHASGSTKLPVRSVRKYGSKSMILRGANDSFAERNRSKQLKTKEPKRDIRTLWADKKPEDN